MRVLRALWFVVVFVIGLLRKPWRRPRIVPEGEPAGGAELVVGGLLLAVGACGVLFVLAYVLDWPSQTQLLGLTLGAALALLSAACIVASRHLVVTEELEEEYPEPGGVVDPGGHEEADAVSQIVEESGSRVTRKKFLAGAAGAAGVGLGAALIAPVAGLGPILDTQSLYDSPWRRGLRLVDDSGQAFKASDIAQEAFYTAFPEGASHEELGSPIVVVRLKISDLELPAGRNDWAPEGIVAYSKICTHAGCAVALYRKPLFPPAEPEPALVCPCHYSTFNPATGGTVIFGPAGRDLPQLPLEIDGSGFLRASGNFSGPVGPSFWGVRTRRPRST
jgi:ubiquinol-cytochrome c reductase iron-sulfur subunit